MTQHSEAAPTPIDHVLRVIGGLLFAASLASGLYAVRQGKPVLALSGTLGAALLLGSLLGPRRRALYRATRAVAILALLAQAVLLLRAG